MAELIYANFNIFAKICIILLNSSHWAEMEKTLQGTRSLTQGLKLLGYSRGSHEGEWQEVEGQKTVVVNYDFYVRREAPSTSKGANFLGLLTWSSWSSWSGI